MTTESNLVKRAKARPFYGQGHNISRSYIDLTAEAKAGINDAIILKRLRGSDVVTGVGVVAELAGAQIALIPFIREVGSTATDAAANPAEPPAEGATGVYVSGRILDALPSGAANTFVTGFLPAIPIKLDRTKEYELCIQLSANIAPSAANDRLGFYVDIESL